MKSQRGWCGWRPLRIIKVIAERPTIKSYYLASTDDTPLFRTAQVNTLPLSSRPVAFAVGPFRLGPPQASTQRPHITASQSSKVRRSRMNCIRTTLLATCSLHESGRVICARLES